MQSKMTEREWFAGMEELIEAGEGFRAASLEMSKRAGLEFAPEPVKLRAELALRPDLVPSDDCPAIAPPDDFFLTKKERDAHYAAAVARYNAYPGLREAAEALRAEMVKLWPDPCTYGHRLRACLDAVKVELAKGPK